MKVEIMATVDGFQKIFPEVKKFDQKVSLNFAHENFQALQYEL